MIRCAQGMPCSPGCRRLIGPARRSPPGGVFLAWSLVSPAMNACHIVYTGSNHSGLTAENGGDGAGSGDRILLEGAWGSKACSDPPSGGLFCFNFPKTAVFFNEPFLVTTDLSLPGALRTRGLSLRRQANIFRSGGVVRWAAVKGSGRHLESNFLF